MVGTMGGEDGRYAVGVLVVGWGDGRLEGKKVGLLDVGSGDGRREGKKVGLLDVGSGDEVIVPSNTYIATVLAVSENGYRYFNLRGIPLFYDDGSLHEWVGTIKDVTDARTAQNALHAGAFTAPLSP